MAKVLVTDTYLSNIAGAIRNKLGVQTTYTPPQMAGAIASIPTGVTPTGTIQITQNGLVDVSQYANANVNVSGGGGGNVLCDIDFTKTVTPYTQNNVTFDSNGATFTEYGDSSATSGGSYIVLPFARNGMTIEIDVGAMDISSGIHRRFVSQSINNGFIYRLSGVWSIYNGSWEDSSETDPQFFENSTVKIFVDINGKWHIYKNGTLWWEPNGALPMGNADFYRAVAGNSEYTIYGLWMLGSIGWSIGNDTVITGVRIY